MLHELRADLPIFSLASSNQCFVTIGGRIKVVDILFVTFFQELSYDAWMATTTGDDQWFVITGAEALDQTVDLAW